MTITSVLVPVDFSPPSIMAVNYGISLARQFRAQLILLHVLSSGITDGKRDQAESALLMLVGPEDQDDLNLLTIVSAGNVQEGIEAIVKERGVGAIVMGTHGRRLLGRLLIGSVTEALLRKLTIPVMTVSHTKRPLEFKHILFATDLTDAGLKAFSDVVDLARTVSASLVLLHVIAPDAGLYDQPEAATIAQKAQGEYRKEMQERLDRLASQARREGILCEPALRDGDPAVVVLQEADDRSADLIVAAVAKRGAIDRAVFGSTAEALIRRADIPVLCLHVPKIKEDPDEETQIVGHWERR